MNTVETQDLAHEIQAILYPDVPPNLNVEQEKQKEQYQKHLYFNQRHNLRQTRFSYQVLVDPCMLVMLQHFYTKEITKPNKIDEFSLGLSLEKAFFNDFKIVNL